MNDSRIRKARTTNLALPAWAVIHNAAMWFSGLLWANGHHVWALIVGAFGLWSLVWLVALIDTMNDQQKGLET